MFERLNEAIEGIMAAAGVPGVAIGIVEGAEVVFARGYGVRSIDSGEPMTTRTRYPIASTTKAINATLIAMLVDDGLLAWDRPVREYLPEFDLADPVAGRLLTLRDLVSMRTGLPRHDWVWAAGALESRADLVPRFRHLPTVAVPRERFMYNNLTVTLSGHIAELAAGTSWEQLVTDRLLAPLGMDDTVLQRPADATSSYFDTDEGTLVQTEPRPPGATAPSGGVIHSHVDDMVRWAAFNLTGGEAGGRRVISEAAFEELRVPQSLLGEAAAGGYAKTAAYAHGWFVDEVRGDRRVSHGGYLDDVDSTVMTLPDRGVGVVCFSNAGPFGLAKPIAEYALDLALGREPSVSLEDHLAAYREQRRVRREQVANATRVPDAPPSHALADYAGAYDHPGYGSVLIRVDGDRLVLHRATLEVPLAHWHYDSWVAEDSARFGWRENAFDRANRLTFDTDDDGRIAGLSIRFEILAPPIRFSREG